MSPTLLVAFVLMSEAGNQGPIGRERVADVIVNRANSENRSVIEIVLAPYQFSCINGLKPVELEDIMHKYAVQSPGVWRKCVELANKVVLGSWEPRTGYNHYYNPDLCSPSWGTKLRGVKMIGDHKFGIL